MDSIRNYSKLNTLYISLSYLPLLNMTEFWYLDCHNDNKKATVLRHVLDTTCY